MKIIIENQKDTDKISVDFQDADGSQATFENVVAIIFCVLEDMINQCTEAFKDDSKQLDGICEYIAGACDQLCMRCFPEQLSDTFELSDAALLYAEDQIIKRAEKKGITFEEALAAFEEKARKYVAERSGVLNS